MALSYVIGAPAWDRAWVLDLWLDSVRTNVDPKDCGLVFVVPADDEATRSAIAAFTKDFSWVEVQRDRNPQFRREERPETKHATLAAARNQLLGVVNEAKPDHYISWDTDFLVPPGTVEMLVQKGLPLTTVWAWLNRKPPQVLRYFSGEYHEVRWEPPVCATAMAWDPTQRGRALHYPAHEFNLRARGTWRCAVALAWQLMDRRAYGVGHYRPHRDGEDVSFNWDLMERGVPRFCCGDVTGVHLYNQHATHERELGWPGVLKLANQRPLAATWTEPRSVEYESVGLFPMESNGEQSARAGTTSTS